MNGYYMTSEQVETLVRHAMDVDEKVIFWHGRNVTFEVKVCQRNILVTCMVENTKTKKMFCDEQKTYKFTEVDEILGVELEECNTTEYTFIPKGKTKC
jgi:hypothetical protein